MTEPSRSHLHLHYPGSRFSTLVHLGKRAAHIRITCAGRNAMHTHPLIQHYFWAIKANDLLAFTVNLQWLFDHELKNNTKTASPQSHGVYQDQIVSSFWQFLSLVLGCYVYYTNCSLEGMQSRCQHASTFQIESYPSLLSNLFCIVQKACRAGFQKLQCSDSDCIYNDNCLFLDAIPCVLSYALVWSWFLCVRLCELFLQGVKNSNKNWFDIFAFFRPVDFVSLTTSEY